MTFKISAKTINGPLVRKLREISGQDPNECFQCGLCAGSCPMTGEMEFYSRRVMHMLQLGLVQEVIDRNLPHLCASCHTCEVRCPRGIDVPRIVEALRQIALRQGENHLAPESVPKERIREMPQAALVAGFRKWTG